MPLYTKYRPASLKGFRGNQEVVRSVEGILSRSEGQPHAWLLSGPSGCGKTTLGRIIMTRLGVHPHDLQEIDSADFRGIDTIRKIRADANFLPTSGDRRGFILDECHQLSKDAQSGMLKMLEDTPRHAFFVLCTTDPGKLLPTIRNRCTTFSVEPLGTRDLEDLIRDVAEREGIDIPGEAVDQIIMDSTGSARLALVILDKIADLPPAKMLEAARQQGAIQNESIELCRAMINGQPWSKITRLLKGLEAPPEDIRRHVLAYATAVLLGKDHPRAFLVLDAFCVPIYDTGKPGLVRACYAALNGRPGE